MCQDQGNDPIHEQEKERSTREANLPTVSDAPIALSLILIAHNAQDSLAQILGEAERSLAALPPHYEILVIEDGGTDATSQIVTQAALSESRLSLLQLPEHSGYGQAVSRGLEAAKGTLVAIVDAGGNYDLRELDRLKMLAQEYDVVWGYRIQRIAHWRRTIPSIIYNFLARCLLGTGVRDANCGMKLCRREALPHTQLTTRGLVANAELLAQARLEDRSIIEVGVTHRPATSGERNLSCRELLKEGASFSRLWWSSLFAPALENSEPIGEAWSRKREWGVISLILVAAMVLFFGRLGYPLFEPDETRYAQIASEMIHSGDWITPTLGGEPYLDKPPLLYWATAASYLLLGENAWAARLPCAVAALLTILIAYVLGKRLVGGRAACLGAAALLLCGGFVLSGRFIMMDGLLTLFVTATFYAGYLACCGRSLQLGWWILAAIACGLGLLTKGPVALVLCLVPLAGVRWFAESKPRILWRHWALLCGVVLAMISPWFVAISIATSEFLPHFFWKHHVVRFVNTFHHEEPWWYYIPVLFLCMFPVSLLVPALASFLFRRRSRAITRNSQAVGFLMLATVWIVFFFSLSSCKLPAYVLPALPPFCLLMGSLLHRVLVSHPQAASLKLNVSWIPKRTAANALFVAVVAALGNALLFPNTFSGWLLNGAVIVGSSVLSVMWWKSLPVRAGAAWALAVGLAFFVMSYVFFDFVPDFSQSRSIHVQAANLQQQHTAAPIIYFDRQAYTVEFHLPNTDAVYFREDQLVEVGNYLRAHPLVILVSIPAGAETIQQNFGAEIQLTPHGTSRQLYVARPRKPRVATRNKSSIKEADLR